MSRIVTVALVTGVLKAFKSAIANLRTQPLLFCGLGGLAFAFAMPPWGLWFLAWIALIPLWQTGIQQGNWRGVLLWTLFYQGITLHWLWDLHPLTWLGIPWGPSVLITIACWLGVIAWRLAAILLWTKLTFRLGRGKSAMLRVLLGTSLWLAIDLAWSYGPLYWDSFALSQSPHNLAILQLSRWGGPGLVSGAIVAVNGLLAEAWSRGFATPRHPVQQLPGPRALREGPRSQHQSGRWLMAGALLLFIGSHGIGAELYAQAEHQLNQVSAQASTPTLNIGIVQGNVPTREKLSAAGQHLAVKRYAEGFSKLAAAGADAVLLPEGALPLVWSRSRTGFGQAFVQPLLTAIARYPDTQLWLGTFESLEHAFSQSLLALDSQGSITGRYNKIKLVPLGEYIPGEALLQSLVGRLSSLPQGMVPGDRQQQFQTRWGTAAVMICYEPAFSQVARRQVKAGGQWLLNSANLDPYGEVLMAQSEALDVMRAIESDRWLVRATNTGYSGLVSPTGQVLWRSDPGEYLVHQLKLYPRQTQTLYVHWGDWPLLLLLCLTGMKWGWEQAFTVGTPRGPRINKTPYIG